MAQVISFPLARRIGLIRKQANWYLAQDTTAAAESNLRRLLEVQRQALTSKGVAPADIEAEIVQLEAAIRSAYRRLLVSGVAG